MALPDTNLLFQHSVVRLRATVADGVKLRTLLSTSEPLRLEIFDGEDNTDKKESVTLVATVKGGREEGTPSISRAVFLTVESGEAASLRLDNLLSDLIGEVASSDNFDLILDSRIDNLISLPVFRVAIHLAAAHDIIASRLFPLSTVILRVEGVDFPFARELLGLHSEFFYALLYGSFAESGKDLVKLDTFTAEEIGMLHRVMQRGLPVKTENAMTTLAVADRILSPSLMAKLLSLPVPTNQEDKEEWLIIADKYNSMELANRIVQSIPRKEAARVHLKLVDKISNKEVTRFLLMHSLGELRDPSGTIISMDLGRFGTVRVRLFTNQVPEMVEQFLKMLPLTTTLDSWGTDFYIRDIPISPSGKLAQHDAKWTLCAGAHDMDVIKDCPHGSCYPIGEVVDGEEILEGRMQGRDAECVLSIA